MPRENLKIMTEKTVDKWFSKFIRLRDCIIPGYVEPVYIGRCCTCNTLITIWDHQNGFNPNAHCGHFIGRYFKATRYDEQNCNLQCKKCNTFAEGKQFEHGLYIDKKYGSGTAEKLLIKSKQLCKRNRYDLEVLGNFYRTASKQIAKELGIKL